MFIKVYCYYYHYNISLRVFSHRHKLKVFHWSLCDNKSPQVFRTLLSILADLNNAVVWMVSTRLLISNFSSPYTSPLMTLPRCANYNWYHRHFLAPKFVFFGSLARSGYLSLFSLSFNFTQWSAGTTKSIIRLVLSFFFFFFFLSATSRSGRD